MKYEPIAIVGMACRFPGAPDVRGLWSLLSTGSDATCEAPGDRWEIERFYDPDREANGRSFVRRAGFLPSVADFDWRTLRISPKEATAMDPQHRLMLELAWEALEDAGVPFEAAAGTDTGVFVGVVWNDFLRLLARSWERLDGYTAAGGPLAFAANRISHHFDLRGPSFAMDGTCASSLLSVHQACMSLMSGESTMAIAGGVNLILSPDSMVIMSKAGVLSADARCKTLDAGADGFARGEGGGLVVLKRLADTTPHDRVYAVIRGTAVGHNGKNEWIMAPSARAQTEIVQRACERAGLDPAELAYVELHGTGFARGDGLEATALSAALRTNRMPSAPCAIGSIKTNIGNLEAAAGIASVIKVALCLWHGALPPTLHLRQVNPAIDLDALGLAPQRELADWPADRRRVAGVTVTAFSGNNGHAVFESHAAAPVGPTSQGLKLLPLTARSREALRALASRMADWLRADGLSERLEDVCYTAAHRRTHHAQRMVAFGADAEALALDLEAFVAGKRRAPQAAADSPVHELAQRYLEGETIDWSAVVPLARCASLPLYPWQRERLWPEWLTPRFVSTPPECTSASSLSAEIAPVRATPAPLYAQADGDFAARLLSMPHTDWLPFVVGRLRTILRDVLGLPEDVEIGAQRPFFELGMSSLSLLELRTRIHVLIGQPIPAAALFEVATLASLAVYVAARIDERSVRATQPQAERCETSIAALASRRRDEIAGDVAALSEEEATTRLLRELTALEGR
jgi:acyl transferase domain-containing protein